MNPLHSPRKEHSKKEFGKKNSGEKFGESRLLPGANLVLRPALIPPDPINHICSLTGKWILKNYFTYRSVQIFKILFQGFNSPESDPPHKIMQYWVYYSTQ